MTETTSRSTEAAQHDKASRPAAGAVGHLGTAARPDAAAALGLALEARRVAVIGASAVPGKLGYQVIEQAVADGYDGDLVLVNPRGGDWNGRPLVTAEAVAGCDLAVLAVPAERAVAAIADAAGHGVTRFVALPAGFGEAGRPDLDAQLADLVAATGVRVLGPNCLGLFSASNQLNLTTIPNLPRGSVAMISQSGGVIAQTAGRLRQLGDGFDCIISVGNRLDIKLADAVTAAASRPGTGALLMYMEAFDEADRLLDAVRHYRASRGPVVVLMGGRSAASRRAASSHTGSLFGSWARIRALLEQAGAFVTSALEVAVSASLRAAPLPLDGPEVFTVCDGGGHSVLLADALDGQQLLSSEPSPSLRAELAAVLGRSDVTNPLDLAGAADTDLTVYARVAEAVANDGHYRGLIVAGAALGTFADFFGPAAARQELEVVNALIDLRDRLPVVVQTPAATAPTDSIERMRAGGLPVFEWPGELAAWLAAQRNPAAEARSVVVPHPDWDSEQIHGELCSDTEPAFVVDSNLGQATETVRNLLADLAVGDGIGRVVTRDALDRVDPAGRWVLRLDGFPHKVRNGAIHVDVATRDLPSAFDDLASLADRAALPVQIRLAPVIPYTDEFLVTVWGNGPDGRGIAIGGGGSAVEEAGDVALGRIPTVRTEVEAILARTRAGTAFLRRSSEVQRAELAAFVIDFAAHIDDELTLFTEVELNPVVVGPDGVSVLDTLPQAKRPHLNAQDGAHT